MCDGSENYIYEQNKQWLYNIVKTYIFKVVLVYWCFHRTFYLALFFVSNLVSTQLNSGRDPRIGAINMGGQVMPEGGSWRWRQRCRPSRNATAEGREKLSQPHAVDRVIGWSATGYRTGRIDEWGENVRSMPFGYDILSENDILLLFHSVQSPIIVFEVRAFS